MDEQGKVGGEQPFTDIKTRYVVRQDRVVLDLRPFGVAECPVLGRLDYKKGYPAHPPHTHRDIVEFAICKRGSQPYRVGDWRLHLHADEAVRFPPNVSHDSDGHPTYPCLLYWFQLTLPVRGQRTFLGKDVAAMRPVIEFMKSPVPSRARAIETTDEITDRLDRIVSALAGKKIPAKPSPFSALRLNHAIATVLLDLHRLASKSVQSPTAAAVKKIIEEIELKADTPPMSWLCERLHASEPVVAKIFTRVTGYPPHRYFLHRKIVHAQKMLLDGMPVTAVAHNCGFCSSQYFAMQFKKITGVPPSSYAEEIIRQRKSRSDWQT